MVMSEFAHAESISICLGSGGLLISEALVRSGVQVFFCRMSGSIFQEKFIGCALSMLQSEGNLTWMYLFHFINKLSPSPIALENLSMSLHFLVTHLHECPTLKGPCKRVFPCESK